MPQPRRPLWPFLRAWCRRLVGCLVPLLSDSAALALSPLHLHLHPLVQKLSWVRRLALAHSAAKGMLHLHSRHPPILHRDLKVGWGGGALLGQASAPMHLWVPRLD